MIFWLIAVAALGTGLKLNCISGGKPIQCQPVGGGNRVELRAFRALQTVTADLQPAASGPMAAEKQPTWTDDCGKADGFASPQPNAPLEWDRRFFFVLFGATIFSSSL